MAILPEAKVRCPKCQSTVMDIPPEWIAEASTAKEDRGENPWQKLRRKVLDEFKTFGHLKGWMTQGQCPEKECDGKWWDGTKLNVAVPSHLRKETNEAIS